MIRPASAGDLDELVALDEICFARPWTRAQWQDELGSVLIASRDGALIGYACAPSLLSICELRRIAVHPDSRRTGLARDLLARVIEHARLRGCDRVELEVAADNHAAIALYQRRGFRSVGRRPGYYRDPPADALLMDLAIPLESPF